MRQCSPATGSAEEKMQVHSPLAQDAVDMHLEGDKQCQIAQGAEKMGNGRMMQKRPLDRGGLEPSAFWKFCRCLCAWKSWNQDGSGNDKALKEYFQVMLGDAGTERSSQACFAPSLSLEELSPEALNKLLDDAISGTPATSSGAHCSEISDPTSCNTGLAQPLRPYLEDLLTRRRGFRAVADLLVANADEAEHSGLGLPRVFAEVKAKDLFIALLLLSPTRHRARLAAAYAHLRAPVPIMYRAPVGLIGSGFTTASAFNDLRELACVPCRGRELIVSLGTKRVLGGGKTALLGALALTPLDEEQLDIRPSGPVHVPSCDLYCTDSKRWVVDAHGHWSAVDDIFRAAFLSLIAWGRAVCVVHSTAGDFSKAGVPVGELANILASISSLASMPRSDETVACAGVIILVRDVGADAASFVNMDAITQEFGLACLEVSPIEDMRSIKSTARKATVVDRLRTSIEEHLKRAWPGGAATPSLEELLRIHGLLSEGVLARLRVAGTTEMRHHGQLGALESRWSFPTPSPGSGGAIAWRSALGDALVAILDDAYKTGIAAQTLFPLSAVHRRLTTLQRTEAGVGPSDIAIPSGGNTQLEQLKLEEDRSREREAKMLELKAFLGQSGCSQAMKFFLSLATSTDSSAIAEMGLYLEDWKEPKILPLLDRQRELLDKAPARNSSSGESASEKVSKDLKKVISMLDQLDFSMDSFWAELELLTDKSRKQEASRIDQRTLACKRSLIEDGSPFQILHGQPLSMAGSFLRNILETIGLQKTDPRGIFVVSVIGAQSSAKSTLLNFLFGCGFAVRAGRCTRGLYASYFVPSGGPPMLVLDSEGLLSLGSEGAVFDGQIALMCMSCSHLVLVNHKGELSRQLQDLLEVCLFAMRHLRLTRLQPRLVFVLRDQHDRSRAVHEDMLKQMRNHLEDAARTLGSPLHDLIRFDATDVFLLPSAVTSELQQGKEVSWTSELFSREVLRLRGDVFKWLHVDARDRSGSGPPEFTSLSNWYDYAATVWETLVQFGGRLLHYKTIHDIELRRELADVAKTAVQDSLEGNSSADGSGISPGFQKRAQEMVDSFVARVHASPTKLDLETIDMELSRALACLRDECIAHLEDLFEQRTADPRYTDTAKEQARKQIRTPIEWAFENHVYTWKLNLKRAEDEQAKHALWLHFTGVLNRHLANSGHRATVEEAESQALFESEWRAYEAQYMARFKQLVKGWQTLAHEVTLLCNHAVMKLQHETGPLALLKEIGPQMVAVPMERRREANMPCITDQTAEEWEEQYFYTGWWAIVRKRGLQFLQSNGASPTDSNNLIQRMKDVIKKGLDAFRLTVITRGFFDESTAAEGLRHIAGGVLQEIESRLLNDWSVGTLKRPQMLHALHVALRLICIEALVVVEEKKQDDAMKDLLSQKADLKEHFVLIINANKGDVDKAGNFAKLFDASLKNWIDHEITNLTAEVRTQVLQEMPDPQKSSERAWQQSFQAQKWLDVLEYVLDMNAYLEKTFLILFHQRKRSYVGSARSRLEKRIGVTYQLLQDVAKEWARREAASRPVNPPNVDVTTRPAAVVAERSVKELKDFIASHCERVPANAEKAEAHRHLAERLPVAADFEVKDPTIFAEAFQTCISDYHDSPDMSRYIGTKIDKALHEQSVQAWSLIRGCSECCPLCGAKCGMVGEHSRHHCAHHLFPAFHGWMDRTTGLPSFNHCLGCSTREGTYECRDGVWRNLEDYLAKEHPSWLPFNNDQAASERDIPLLRAAWVNCREPLLEYFSPMAEHCPEDWREAHQDQRALTVADLKSAKDTIRKLRDHTWTPPDD